MKKQEFTWICGGRGNGKSIESARKFFEMIEKTEKGVYDIFYIRMSDFVKLYSQNKEMFEFNDFDLKYYFKGKNIEIMFTDNLPKFVTGFFAKKSIFEGGERYGTNTEL